MRPKEILYPQGKTGKIRYYKKPRANNGKEVDGYSYTDRRLIVVRGGASYRRQAEILLHEIIHQALEPLREPPKGSDMEEAIVETIGQNLVELWAKNPKVFLWIHLGLSEESDA